MLSVCGLQISAKVHLNGLYNMRNWFMILVLLIFAYNQMRAVTWYIRKENEIFRNGENKC